MYLFRQSRFKDSYLPTCHSTPSFLWGKLPSRQRHPSWVRFSFLWFCPFRRPPRGEDLVSELQDALTPSHLVNPDICKKLPIFGKMKAFLERFDVDVPVYRETGTLVAKRLICRIWGADEFYQDRRDAFASLMDFVVAVIFCSLSIHNRPQTYLLSPASQELIKDNLSEQFQMM